MTSAWKHRLVGGFTLLVALVLIVPMLFTGNGRVPKARITDIPEAPVVSDEPVAVDSAPDTDTDTRTRVDEIFGLAGEQLEPERPEQAAETGEASTGSTEAEADVPEIPVDEDGQVQAWSVQLGSFRDADNARRLLDEVRAAGYTGYTRDSILSDDSTLIQVMVGPETDLEAVRALEARLSEEFNVSALVIRFRP